MSCRLVAVVVQGVTGAELADVQQQEILIEGP
jgi:hypothetical protein